VPDAEEGNAELGEAVCDSEGEARASLDEAPPPPLLAPTPPCVAVVRLAAEEGGWELDEDAILARDGSWPGGACCDCGCDGEKGDELELGLDRVVDEAGTAVEMGGSCCCMETCTRE
jgi:hypothetical protein